MSGWIKKGVIIVILILIGLVLSTLFPDFTHELRVFLQQLARVF